jgi:hypothetical protein
MAIFVYDMINDEICAIFFRQYDKNKNGFMECHEAVELAKDMDGLLMSQVSSYLRHMYIMIYSDII